MCKGCLLMLDPNFEFLNNEYSKIYKSCEMIDKSFAICQNDFKYPVALSRMTLEEILKFLLNKNYGELHELIDEYNEDNDINDDFFAKLDNIRRKGNRAVHNNSFKRKQAIDVVIDFQKVVRDLLCPFENIKRYVPIEGDEEWINPNIFNQSDELIELYDKLIESNNKVHLLNVKINNFEDNFKELSNKV